MKKLGIFTQYIQADNVEALAGKVQGYGLEAVVLDSYPGLDVDPLHLDIHAAERVRRAFEQQQVEIAALGAYVNLLDPDAEARARIIRGFNQCVSFAGEVGAPLICTELGSYHPNGWEWDPANATDKVFEMALETVLPIAELAEKHGVTLTLEPYVMSAAYSAERLASFLERLDCRAVKVVFDPAGLLTRATMDRQEQVIGEAFKLLEPHIGLVHTQDCRPAARWQDHFDWLGAGNGQVDYKLFMDLLSGSSYDGPFILEFLQEQQIEQCTRHVRGHYMEALNRRKQGE